MCKLGMDIMVRLSQLHAGGSYLLGAVLGPMCMGLKSAHLGSPRHMCGGLACIGMLLGSLELVCRHSPHPMELLVQIGDLD